MPASAATSPEGSQWAWTRSASRDARRAARTKPGQEERQREHEPRPAAEVADDPVPVGDPEVAEVRRRDDLDVDPGRPNVLDRVPHEVTGDVVRMPRIRGRQHDDLQESLRPKTIGAASTSVANA